MQRLLRVPGGWRFPLFAVALCGLLRATEGTAPVITGSPSTQTVNAGQDVTLTVTAEGTAPLSYAWWFEEELLSGATDNNLRLTNVNALNTGSYVAVVSNAFGSATSAPAVLTVIGPPVILQGPTNVSVYLGQSATFEVLAFSRTDMTYQWQFGGADLPSATNSSLTVAQVTTNNAGSYTVRVANHNGSVTTAAAQLTALALPPPSLALGVIHGEAPLRVPVLYTAYGIETNLSFSVSWDPAVYSFAGFEPELQPSAPDAETADGGVSVALNEDQLAEGRLGVTLSWNPGLALPPGPSTIAQVVFGTNEGQTNAFAGRLAFADTPVASVVAPPIEGTNTIVLYGIYPQ
ncbi:MAG: immunoglobulin domain-containing protein, partial [Verrucomicrobiae bacterium]|nr:immunoglobulin domain-containing protein [Verrucomicrobiae bacterium]